MVLDRGAVRVVAMIGRIVCQPAVQLRQVACPSGMSLGLPACLCREPLFGAISPDQAPAISSSVKKMGISRALDSGESEPWTRFSVKEKA